MSVTELFFLRTDEYLNLQQVLTRQTIEWAKEWIPYKSDEAYLSYKKSKLHLAGEIVANSVTFGDSNASLVFAMSKKDHLKYLQLLAQTTSKDTNSNLNDELIKHLYKECFTDLANVFCENRYEIQMQATQTVDGFYRSKNQGEIVGEYEVAGLKLFIILNSGLVKLLCERKSKNQFTDISAVKDQLGNEVANVCVTIGSAKIKLCELQKLSAGDVVVLEQTIDKPSKVTIGSKKKSFPGVLMRSKQYKAIKFV